ncbi:MAG: hypothetical protein ABI678_25590 [Kofleriaceae bacterium]
MSRLVSLAFLFAACTSNGNDPIACQGDHCQCDVGDCAYDCTPGAAECHVEGGGGPVDVHCNDNAECHVECSGSPTCDVDCGGSTECHVTCPATGCTVTNCVGEGCVVACGTFVGIPTQHGTTATCP